MEEYRKVLPLKMPDQEERECALGTLIGEKFTLKKTYQALQNSELFEVQDQQGPGEWMFENEVEGQPYSLYTSSFINYLSEQRKTIYLVKLNCSIPLQDYKIVKKSIKAFYHGAKVKSIKLNWKLDLNQCEGYQSEKYGYTLYNSQKILRQMQDHIPKDAYCMIALTDHFIYNMPNEKSLFSCPMRVIDNEKQNPDDWQLFGLASLKDRVGVVNYTRFSQPTCRINEEEINYIQEQYSEVYQNIPKYEIQQLQKESKQNLNITNNKQQKQQNKSQKNSKIKQKTKIKQQEEPKPQIEIYWKDIPGHIQEDICKYDQNHELSNLLKVVNHEISHMFGIKHCIYYKCVMNGSSYGKFRFQDFIDKPFDLCLVCLRKLQHNMGFNVIERYEKLQKFCKNYSDLIPFSNIYQQLINLVEDNLQVKKQTQNKVQKDNTMQQTVNQQK